MFKTLVYSPDVRIFIEQTDVSSDVISGNVSLVENGISSMSFSLSNKDLRYSNRFRRMDRVTISMKRVGPWIPVFTGYLDVVPGLQLYPGRVDLKASCTLKVLKYAYWDPGLPESLKLLDQQAIPWGEYGGGSSGGTTDDDPNADDPGVDDDPDSTGWADSVLGTGGILGNQKKKPADRGDSTSRQNTGGSTPAAGDKDSADSGDAGLADSMGDGDTGLGKMLKNVLIKVGGWNESEVKVQEFPSSFMTFLQGAIDADEISGMHDSQLEAFRQLFDFYESAGTGGSSGGGDLGEAEFTTIGPPSNGSEYSFDELAWIVLNGGWRGDDAAIGVAIIKAESRGNPGATNTANSNGTVDRGLWQINSIHDSRLPGENRYDPAVSTRLARMIYQDAGNSWQPWSTFNAGLHMPYLAEARAAVQRGGTAPPQSGTKGSDGKGSLGGIVDSVVDKSAKNTKTKDDKKKGNGDKQGPDTSGMAIWESIWAVAHYKFPMMSLTSAYYDRIGPNDDGGYHGKGMACDISNGGDEGTPEMKALAQWWYDNFLGKGLLQLIHSPFNHNVGDDRDVGDGMTEYYDPGTMAGHRNHVHIAMAGRVSADGTTDSGSVALDGGGGMGSFQNKLGKNIFTYMFDPASFMQEYSQSLTGKYAAVNDEPLLKIVTSLCTASMRSFRSAPDGKFLAYYPDYFGLDGTAPSLVLEDIEMKNVRIDINDDAITTHVYTQGASSPLSPQAGGGGNEGVLGYMRSPGVVTIEDEWLFKRVTSASYFPPETTDAMEFMQRYGIRPYKRDFDNIYREGHEASILVLAIKEFMDKWAQQYQTRIELTFMPELFPGMRVELAGHDLVVYVQSVHHNFSFDSGFTTTANVVAPQKASWRPDQKAS